MLTRRPLRLLVALVAVAAASPAQQFRMPRVEVHSDPEVDFSAFQTFGWKAPVSAAERPEVHTSIYWYVDRGLEEKGLTKIPDGSATVPDLFVRYYAKGRSSIQGTPVQTQDLLPGSPKTMTTSFDLHKVRAGTLILELQRASDNKAVWRAGTDISRIDQKRIDAEVRRAVQLLLAKYPPKSPTP